MYHWQFCIDDCVIFGRTWIELELFFERLKTELSLTCRRKLVIYVHNFAFEFQFMKTFFNFENVFAREVRKPIKAETDCFEFRCSYYLSNMSLDKFCKNTQGNKFWKLKDDYNYRKLRTPKTELTEIEKAYCYIDVRGLAYCIKERLKEDTIISIPLTSTGYVRRIYRKEVLKNPKNKRLQKRIALNLDQYNLCKEAFRGGDTHANYLWSGEILENIDSYDKTSDYPAVMELEKYPMTKFIKVSQKKMIEKMDDHACLFRARFENVRCTSKAGSAYIDIAHCRKRKNVVGDNGRVLSADALEITLTDIDYKIILDEYEIEHIYLKDCYIAKYDYLPYEIRKTLLSFFEKKTVLKGVEGSEYEYTKSKNVINSSYGMMVTDITQDEIIFNGEDWETVESNKEELLRKYYENKKTFLSYQHGVWVTAHARAELHKAQKLIGSDSCYWDTDSLKCHSGNRKKFTELNKEIYRKIEKTELKPVAKMRNGKLSIMGIWEFEGCYTKFITYGSKKYAYEKDGKISVTVAGLSKKKGSEEIQKNGIEDFKIGKVFHDSGRLTAYYNDDEVHTININGEEILTGANVALVDTSYTLGVTNEYTELIQKN